MKVTKITIGRLYNLGSYEHIRYEIAVEIGEKESAEMAMIGLERILEGLKPESKWCVKSDTDLKRQALQIAEYRECLEKSGPDEFRRKHGWFEGTSEEYIARCAQIHAEETAKRVNYLAQAAKAHELLDNLAGAAEWKDCKLGWEQDDEL